MNAAEIIMRDIERGGRNVIIKFLANAVRQSREPAIAHAERKVLALNIAGRNVLLGIA